MLEKLRELLLPTHVRRTIYNALRALPAKAFFWLELLLSIASIAAPQTIKDGVNWAVTPDHLRLIGIAGFLLWVAWIVALRWLRTSLRRVSCRVRELQSSETVVAGDVTNFYKYHTAAIRNESDDYLNDVSLWVEFLHGVPADDCRFRVGPKLLCSLGPFPPGKEMEIPLIGLLAAVVQEGMASSSGQGFYVPLMSKEHVFAAVGDPFEVIFRFVVNGEPFGIKSVRINEHHEITFSDRLAKRPRKREHQEREDMFFYPLVEQLRRLHTMPR